MNEALSQVNHLLMKIEFGDSPIISNKSNKDNGLAAVTRLALGALLGSDQHLAPHHKADRLKKDVYSYLINQSRAIVCQPAAEKARLVSANFL